MTDTETNDLTAIMVYLMLRNIAVKEINYGKLSAKALDVGYQVIDQKGNRTYYRRKGTGFVKV